MTDPTPQITPPPELVREWVAETWHEGTPVRVAASDLHIATQAARWGCDQAAKATEEKLQKARDEELEACCEFMQHEDFHGFAKELRAARRPKPTSLKQQALDVLEHARKGWTPVPDDWDIIRRALETVDDCPSPHRP